MFVHGNPDTAALWPPRVAVWERGAVVRPPRRHHEDLGAGAIPLRGEPRGGVDTGTRSPRATRARVLGRPRPLRAAGVRADRGGARRRRVRRAGRRSLERRRTTGGRRGGARTLLGRALIPIGARLRAFLDQAAAADAPPIQALPLAGARGGAIAMVLATDGPKRPVAVVDDPELATPPGPLRAPVYRPH